MSSNNRQISSQQGFHGLSESLRVGTRKAWQGFSTHCLKLTETKDIFGITHDVTMVLTSAVSWRFQGLFCCSTNGLRNKTDNIMAINIA